MRPGGLRRPAAAVTMPANPPPAQVLLYAPAGRRRMWWYPYVCPTGQLIGHGVPGSRRGGCGHWRSITITRTFGDAP